MTESSRLQPITNYLNAQFEHLNSVSKDYKSSLKNTNEIFAYTEELHNTLKKITDMPQKHKDRISEQERLRLLAEQDALMQKLKTMQSDIEKSERNMAGHEIVHQSEQGNTQTNKKVLPETKSIPIANSVSASQYLHNTSVGNEELSASVETQPSNEENEEKNPKKKDNIEWASDSDKNVSADVEELSSSKLPESSTTETTEEHQGKDRTEKTNSFRQSDSMSASRYPYKRRSAEDTESFSRISRLDSILNTDRPLNLPDENRKDKTRKDKTRKDKIQLSNNDPVLSTHDRSPQDITLITPSIVNQPGSLRQQKIPKSNQALSLGLKKKKNIIPDQITLLSLPSHITDAQKRRGKIVAKIVHNAK